MQSAEKLSDGLLWNLMTAYEAIVCFLMSYKLGVQSRDGDLNLIGHGGAQPDSETMSLVILVPGTW
jgi:hypothetical protein